MAVNEFAEFQKQYEKTWIRVQFESTNELQVVNVRACISDDVKNPYIVLYNPPIGQTTVKWGDTKQRLDYEFPEPGLFNFAESFYMFHRFPDRQWKKGVSQGNARMSDPLYGIRNRIRHGNNFVTTATIDYAALTAAFSQNFPSSISDAFHVLEEPSVLGVALSPIFGITKSPTNPASDLRCILWKHLNMIGWVDPVSRSIEVVEPFFLQEVTDFIHRKQESSWSIR